MKIAIVHDYLNQYGGAEKVLEALHGLYPTAPIYTSMYDPRRLPDRFAAMDIRTSFMQRLPGVRRKHQSYLPLYALAFERFDLSSYDLVLSSSSAWAKGVITSPRTLHVCYCHAPMRFAWNYQEYVRRESVPRPLGLLLSLFLSYVRVWDESTSRRVDHFIANSREVAGRVAKYYRRQATIINPPVEAERFHVSAERGGYFLMVSRLIPYKRLDLAIAAFNHLRLPLWIAGTGRDRARLERLAGPTITFLGSVDPERLSRLYAECRAFVFPGEEDFGIAPLEAQAAGRPVIAYAGGGALETVRAGVTGAFFSAQSAEALAETVRDFREADFSPAVIRAHAERFDVSIFKERIRDYVAERVHEWHTQRHMPPETFAREPHGEGLRPPIMEHVER